MLIACVCALAVLTFAQQPASPPVCDNGLIELQGNVTGRLTVCSALAIQAPQLARQLEAISEALKGQQRQITQLTRLVRGVNSVGQNMGSKRQSELLRNLFTQLETNQRVGADQAERLMTVLAEAFERLRDSMVAGLMNGGSAERVQAALEGVLGDSIAQLNLSEAEKQLSDIRAQLQTIGSQLAEANQRTANIQATLDERRMDMPRVASAVGAADVRALRALSAAGLQTTVLEEALRVTDAKGQTTASRFFENSAGSADAVQWFEDALAAGLDPNLTVPSTDFDREALLSVAMQAANVPAMRRCCVAEQVRIPINASSRPFR